MMRLRVVCGLAVTMAIFSPGRAFINVLFPALGRPRMATNPDVTWDNSLLNECTVCRLDSLPVRVFRLLAVSCFSQFHSVVFLFCSFAELTVANIMVIGFSTVQNGTFWRVLPRFYPLI